MWLDKSEHSLDLPGDRERDLFSRVAYRCHNRSIRLREVRRLETPAPFGVLTLTLLRNFVAATR